MTSDHCRIKRLCWRQITLPGSCLKADIYNPESGFSLRKIMTWPEAFYPRLCITQMHICIWHWLMPYVTCICLSLWPLKFKKKNEYFKSTFCKKKKKPKTKLQTLPWLPPCFPCADSSNHSIVTEAWHPSLLPSPSPLVPRSPIVRRSSRNWHKHGPNKESEPWLKVMDCAFINNLIPFWTRVGRKEREMSEKLTS